jgi:hypothetical protein
VSAQSRQLIGSLLVAFAIVAVTIALVTAKLGPRDPSSERDDGGGSGVEQRDDSGSGRSGGDDDDDR